jgi:hypothetical protein
VAKPRRRQGAQYYIYTGFLQNMSRGRVDFRASALSIFKKRKKTEAFPKLG